MNHDDPGSPSGRSRRTGWMLLAAVLITVPVVSLLLRPDDLTLPEPDDPPDDTRVLDVDFADPRNGFALRGCAQTNCRLELLFTEDGRTWTARDLPSAVDPSGVTGVTALGRCRVAIDDTAGDFDRRMYTNDCGTFWSYRPAFPHRDIDEIPDGARLLPACQAEGAGHRNCHTSLSVLDQDTGEHLQLTSAPRLENPGDPVYDSGAWWVTGTDPDSGELAVSVTHDDSRTWKTTSLLAESGYQRLKLQLAVHGRHGYAVAFKTTSRPAELVAVFHSADGGSTWERTRGPDGGGRLRIADAVVLARPDGLLVAGQEVTRYSDDHGRTFTESDAELPRKVLRRTHGGYVGTDDHHEWRISPDGIEWERIRFPDRSS